jgi:hypothetical protein
MVLYVLPVKTAIGSLWMLVWPLPGASAMRAIDRIQVVTAFVADLAIAAGLAVLSRSLQTANRSTLRRGGLSLVLLLAAVEQINTDRTSSVNRVEQVRFLRSAPRAPAACRGFFVTDSGPRKLPFFEYQIDAMLVSQRLHVATINGYSGHFPPGWHLFVPSSPAYRASVRDWSSTHHLLASVCEFDVTGESWDTSPFGPFVGQSTSYLEPPTPTGSSASGG